MSNNPVQRECASSFQLMSCEDGPQVGPILDIHRGADGFVCFCRMTDSGWENLASIQVTELDSMFPEFRQELLRDSYFSVNAFWRGGNGRNRKWPRLRAPYRETNGLRYLNACYADLDCYKVGLDSGMLAGIVLSAQSNGLIPPVSIFARSGRGVWLFWFLGDPRTPGLPPRCWPDKFLLYMRIQRALHDRLAQYGADALDAVRVTRVPGSIHTGINEPVTYLLQADVRGRGFVHTLEGMAQALSLPDTPRLAPAKRSGWLALQAKRLRQFETLRALRGGFSDGCRNRALLLFVTFMSKNGCHEAAIIEHARKFGAECRPPLTDSEVRAGIASGLKRYRITDRSISDWLMISPGEADMLETWDAASYFGSRALPEAKRLSRKELVGARRESVRRIVAEAGRVPSVRATKALLQEQGITSSWVTVASDYGYLGLISDCERKRRRRRQEISTQLKIPKAAC